MKWTAQTAAADIDKVANKIKCLTHKFLLLLLFLVTIKVVGDPTNAESNFSTNGEKSLYTREKEPPTHAAGEVLVRNRNLDKRVKAGCPMMTMEFPQENNNIIIITIIIILITSSITLILVGFNTRWE